MKRLLLLAVLCLPVFAQTAINDTMYLQGSTAWTGQITVSWPAFTNCAGTAIAKGSRVSTVNAGAVAISLWATDCASPSFAYTAIYRTMGGVNHGQTWTETWAIPSSPSIVTLGAVRQTSTLKFFPSQIIAAGLDDGTYCISVASELATGLTACSGGGGGGTPGGTSGQFQYNSSGSFAGGTLANCLSTGGVLQYNSSTHAFSCHTLAAGDIPTLNQNTTGTAANLSGTPDLPNGTTATTQSQADNSTKLATTAYVDTLGATKAASGASTTVNGTACALGSSCTVTVDGAAMYSCSVSAAASVACTHNLGTTTPQVWCYDSAGYMIGSTESATAELSVRANSSNLATITFSAATTGTCMIGTGGQGPQGATGATGPQGNTPFTISFTLDGGGTALAAGQYQLGQAGDRTCTITGWSLVADQSGSISIDLDRHASSAPPSAPAVPNNTTDKISAFAPMALSAAQTASGGTSAVSTWTTASAAWDSFAVNVTGTPSSVTRVIGKVFCQ